MATLADRLKIYAPPTEQTSPTSHDAGVEWVADVMAKLASMGMDFAKAIVALGVYLLRSLYNATKR